MTEPVDHCDENPVRHPLHDAYVAGRELARQGACGHGPVQEGQFAQSPRVHFFITTVVPSATCDEIANSSISRRAPGRPKPIPEPVV